MSEEKRGRGRPKAETTMTPMWKEIILEAGRNGHHISHFLIELGISYDTHYEMIKRNKFTAISLATSISILSSFEYPHYKPC